MNGYLRHSAGSLHRRLYSGRIILVTKSIITAAIKIHTGRPFGMILVVVGGGCLSTTTKSRYTFGVEKIVGRVAKVRVDTGLPPRLHRQLSPSAFMLRNGWQKKKIIARTVDGFSQENGTLNKSSPRVALSLCLKAISRREKWSPASVGRFRRFHNLVNRWECQIKDFNTSLKS